MAGRRASDVVWRLVALLAAAVAAAAILIGVLDGADGWYETVIGLAGGAVVGACVYSWVVQLER